jgi:hypothetical protein
MSRIVEFDENALCEECGSKGAYDFPWASMLCSKCSDPQIDEDSNQDSNFSCTICGSYFLDLKRHPQMCQYCIDNDGA